MSGIQTHNYSGEIAQKVVNPTTIQSNHDGPS
jgi:hypothetical protein